MTLPSKRIGQIYDEFFPCRALQTQAHKLIHHVIIRIICFRKEKKLLKLEDLFFHQLKVVCTGAALSLCELLCKHDNSPTAWLFLLKYHAISCKHTATPQHNISTPSSLNNPSFSNNVVRFSLKHFKTSRISSLLKKALQCKHSPDAVKEFLI